MLIHYGGLKRKRRSVCGYGWETKEGVVFFFLVFSNEAMFLLTIPDVVVEFVAEEKSLGSSSFTARRYFSALLSLFTLVTLPRAPRTRLELVFVSPLIMCEWRQALAQISNLDSVRLTLAFRQGNTVLQ